MSINRNIPTKLFSTRANHKQFVKEIFDKALEKHSQNKITMTKWPEAQKFKSYLKQPEVIDLTHPSKFVVDPEVVKKNKELIPFQNGFAINPLYGTLEKVDGWTNNKRKRDNKKKPICHRPFKK